MNRLLFLGNSITYHVAVPEDGFMNTCGMAASDAQHDYVHILLQRIASINGSSPECTIENIADFERGYAKLDMPDFLSKYVDFSADTLILAIGENVEALDSPQSQQTYAASFGKLIDIIRESGCENIIVRSCFWPEETKDSIMHGVCQERGGIWVDISDLVQDEANFARSERQFSHEGIAAHPGDRGMLAIANAIWSAMLPLFHN